MRRFQRSLAVPSPARGLLLGVLCAIIAFGVRHARRFDGLEHATLDTLFQARGPRFPSPHIVILIADDATVARFGGWPLPRRVYADVVRRLHRAGAKTIAFDVLFPTDALGGGQDDAAFVSACREARCVVHATVLNAEYTSDLMSHAPGTVRLLPPRFKITDQGAPCINAISGSTARPALLIDAVGMGSITVFPERDGALRRIPNIIRYRGHALYPSLAVAAATHYLDLKPSDVVALKQGDGGDLRLAGRRVPLDAHGETLVNWVGANGAIPTFTFNQFLDGQVPDEVLKDHVVMVGITATGAYEHHATAFSPNQPAIELQANALDDILSNRLLHEAPPWLELGLLLTWPALSGALVAGRNAKISGLCLLALSFVLWCGAALLFGYANFYVPVAATLVATIVTCSVSVGWQQIGEAHSLRIAEERYALAMRGANDGLWDWNLKTDEIYYSPRWKAMLGHDSEEIGHKPDEWFQRIHSHDVQRVREELDAHLAGETPHFESEYRILHNNGDYCWALSRGVLVQDGQGQPSRIAGSQTDITGRKEDEATLLRNAFYDTLTGLPNRALFVNRLEQAISRAKRDRNDLFAVLFLDLDRFKNINDSLGHTRGDELLQEVAHRLTSCLRPADTAARLGGDEFTLLLDHVTHLSDAIHVADRCQQALSQPFELSGHELCPTVSIGIALSTTPYERAEDILRDADTAMYRAKAMGTSCYAVFDEAMHVRAVALLRLETDLRRALEQQNLLVHYQAIVSLETDQIVGFEALARWRHPTRGPITPGEFIPVAEDTGLIIAIDQWVLREACRELRVWQKRFSSATALPLTISVNLSSKQFAQPDLVAKIERMLNELELEPCSLRLEITESVIMTNAKSAAAMLLQLKTLGVHLSIDDFGTGYSSLSYLHQFPFDTLKIDRSFVSRLGTQGEHGEIVRAIIDLAHSLGLKVTAEGVETAEQLAQLKALGCNYGQGYLFSRPVGHDEAFALLTNAASWGSDGSGENRATLSKSAALK